MVSLVSMVSILEEKKKITFDFECAYIKKQGWLFHCNTGTKAKMLLFYQCNF